MGKGKNNQNKKHDYLCTLVSNELTERGWKVKTNIEYKGKRNGEIDVLAYKDNYVLDIEVKCNLRAKNRRKAIDQLDRAYRFCPFFKDKKIYTMMAYEKGNKIEYEWVRQYDNYVLQNNKT